VPVFTYKASDRTGRSVHGSLTADTPASGRGHLQQQGLHVLKFEPARYDKRNVFVLQVSRSRRQEQAFDFARQLAMLLSTGVPLVEALDVLVSQQKGRFACVLRSVRDKIAAGSSLSDALAVHPSWFDALFCSAVRVGQVSGRLDVSLKELAEYIRDRQTVRARLFTALSYPIILTVVGTGVVIFLMSYVVPQLLTVLEASGRQLPVATLILKTFSDVLTGYWGTIILTILAAVSGCLGFYRWRPGRALCHTLQLRLPLAGMLIRKGIISQFAQMMSLLLRTGVPFLEALSLARRNNRHLVLEAELGRMEEAVRRGSDIAPTLEHSKVFPPLVVHMVNVGQASGELTEMLNELKQGYETELRLAVSRFTAVLEPALIVAMSVVVGFVVFATMTPILEVSASIQ